MGDAGPLAFEAILEAGITATSIEHETPPIRQVTVLVTGFGPFKTFNTNPSWLVASSLPTILQPQQPSSKAASVSQSPTPKYVIRLIVHPSPVRVAYATASTLIRQLIDQHNPDYIMHIGMAGGRDHYTLETIAHRDNYKIKDVDDRDGWREGEHVWRKEDIPECLRVGWDEADVLTRWERELDEVEAGLGLVDESPAPTPGPLVNVNRASKKSVVRLSRDAGRYLCEFTLMESLSRRWLEAKTDNDEGHSGSKDDSREGKVAFLHLPGGYSTDDVARGVRVAEAAIRSFIGSWEDGKRRKEGTVSARAVAGARWEGVVWKA